MSCCSGGAGNGAYWAGGKWHELECEEGRTQKMLESVYGCISGENLSHELPIDPWAPTPKVCECGSDRTYGSDKATHSSWCPKGRK